MNLKSMVEHLCVAGWLHRGREDEVNHNTQISSEYTIRILDIPHIFLKETSRFRCGMHFKIIIGRNFHVKIQ